MGLCGCYPACACALTAGNALVTIVGDGDPASGGWVVSGVETPLALGNDDGGVAVTLAGAYGHASRLNLVAEDSDTIALSVTPGVGLQAFLLNAPAEGGGTITGMPVAWLSNIAPLGYLMMSGPNYANYVSIATYPELFAVIGHMGSNYVDPLDGTFKIPDMTGKSIIGGGGAYALGQTGGAATVALAETELAAHAHSATDIDGFTSSDGAHTHTPATAGRSFITAETATITTKRVAENGAGAIVVAVSPDGADFVQLNNGSTTSNGAHAHDTPDGGVTVGSAGSGTAHENMPPFLVGNWIIRT